MKNPANLTANKTKTACKSVEIQAVMDGLRTRSGSNIFYSKLNIYFAKYIISGLLFRFIFLEIVNLQNKFRLYYIKILQNLLQNEYYFCSFR